MTRGVVVLVLLSLVALLLHRRLAVATGLGRGARRAVAVVLALLTLAAATGFVTGSVLDPAWARPVAFVGLSWLVVVLYLLLGLLVIGVVLLGARLVRRGRGPVGREPVDPSRRRALRLATGVLVVGALGATGYGLVAAASPRVVRVRVPLADLPAGFEGTRVALVSDLHLGPTRGAAFARRVVEQVNAEQPDLVALAGDLVDGTVELVGADLAPLADLRAPLGVFGVTGNHEYYAGDVDGWVRYWPQIGITPLLNSRVELRRGDDVVDLAGVDDYTGEAPYEADLGAALAGSDPARTLLLLAHQPRQVLTARDAGVDLQLSGHTHGGQVWPVRLLVPLQQPAVTGLDRFGSTALYTTAGTGTWGPPVRVGATPEITVLELVRR